MTSFATRLRTLVTTLAIPVGGLLFSYALVIDYPLRKRAGEARAKVARITEALKQREPEHTANVRSLDQTKQAQLELSKLVSVSKAPSTELAEVAVEPPPASVSDSPLSRLSAALNLLEQHGVTCVASDKVEPTTDTKPNKQAGQATPEPNIMRLTLEGRFGDMHAALSELQADLRGVTIVSLDMQAAPTGSSVHRWIIVLQI